MLTEDTAAIAIPEATSCDPIFRWMGSKRRSARAIADAIGAVDGTYLELFAGSAAVLFALQPMASVLNDRNRVLMNAYTVLAGDPVGLRNSAVALPADRESYYEIRAASDRARSSFDEAVSFTYLNRYCFNGIYRTNRAHQFNVPFGESTGSVPPLEAFVRCSAGLQGVQLLSGDFEEAMDGAGEGDVVYLDPPYPTERPTYGEYGYGGFSAQDLDRMEANALAVVDRGGRVVLSLPEGIVRSRKGLGAWRRLDHSVRYKVSAQPRHRRAVGEVTLCSW
jgi:DNA adenine methylase